MDKITVHFRYGGDARFTLCYPDAFTELPLANLRKLFALMMQDANADAIYMTHGALKVWLAETMDAAAAASAAYQQGAVDTKSLPQAARRQASDHNKSLLATAKSAEAAHKRAEKLLASFEDLKIVYCW